MGQGISCSEAETIENNGVYHANGPSMGNGCRSCHNAEHSSWYKFHSQEKSILTISSCSFFASNTNLFIYRGSCGNLNLIAQNDDGCGAIYGNASYLDEILVLPGETYYLEWNNEHSEEDFEFEFTVEKITTECTKSLNFQLDSIVKTSAYFSWQSANNKNFFIEYGPVGFEPGSAHMIEGTIGVDGPPVEISNLEEGTLYQVFAYESCGNGKYSDTTNSIYFRSGYLCRAPSFFSFELDSVSPNYAKINWESRNPGAEFEFTYSTRPFNINLSTKLTGKVNTDGPPVELINLEEKTEYEFIYFEQCEEGISDTISRYFVTPPWCSNPTNPTQTFKSDNSAIIEWDSENDNAEYVIRYAKRPWNYLGGSVISGDNTGLFAEIENLEKNNIYDAFIIETCENGYPSDSVFFTFSTNYSPLENDSCSLAKPISCGENHSQNLEGANYTQSNDYCGTITFGNDAWYSLNGLDKLIKLSTCGSETNTSIMVFEGTCASLTCIGGSDESPYCQYPGSYFEFNASLGKNYFIKIASPFGNGGAYILTVDCEEFCTPQAQNDLCKEAKELEVKNICVYTKGSNLCATINPNFNNCAPFERIQDTWYKFKYQGENQLSLLVSHSQETYFKAALYRSCNYELIQCFDEIIPNQETELNAIDLEMGEEYLIQLWNEGFNFSSDYEICLTGENSNIVAENKVNKIYVYPNPVNDLLYVDNPSEIKSVSITNSLGKQISYSENINNTLNLNHLKKGIYILEMKLLNGASQKEILVKK